MVTIISSAIAAFGTMISAYIAVAVRTTKAAVNGNLAELLARVRLLEEIVAFASDPQTTSTAATSTSPSSSSAGDGRPDGVGDVAERPPA